MKITDALLGEHGAFYAQFDRLDEQLPVCRDVAEVREQAALLAAALVSHARLEDELLFPAMSRASADPGLLEAMESEHEAIADRLSRAQGTADLALARNELLEAVSLARDHFAKEERLAFPLADELLGAPSLQQLGASWAMRRDVFVA
jgi:iron-sulfur cluster repair protein YtfE (RIC family)